MKASDIEVMPEVKLLDLLAHTHEKLPQGTTLSVIVSDDVLWEAITKLVPPDQILGQSLHHMITCQAGRRVAFKTSSHNHSVTTYRSYLTGFVTESGLEYGYGEM